MGGKAVSSLRVAGCAAFVAGLLGGPGFTSAAECPPVLRQATRLVLVTTDGFETSTAKITTYERARPDEGWVRNAGPMAATVGRNGLAWTFAQTGQAAAGEPIKVEGDKRTPAGVFPAGRPFGLKAASYPDYLTLKPAETFCVDDARSASYGRIVAKRTLEVGTTGEDMATIPLYRQGLVVDTPVSAARKSGSCIFFHLWRRPGSATVGCIASGEAEITNVQAFASGARTAIAILPGQALVRFGRCLPGPG